jgi:hypothetical protein
MRFIVIADRFQLELGEIVQKRRDLKRISKSDRSVDELKDRYYQVAKEVLIHRG